MRVATWNVNSLNARWERVVEWLTSAAPDVVCLQETKLADADFPAMPLLALGYDSVHHGDGRWNGVAILSRVGLDEVQRGFDRPLPGHPAEPRVVAATCGGVRIRSVYVPNGREVGHDHWHFKLAWLEHLRSELAAESAHVAQQLVAGDFNIAPEDRDVWSVAAFDGATHVSTEERAALAGLLDLGLIDVFRTQHADGGLFSWWDYRAGDFHQGRGMRIDLILASAPVANRLEWSLIDRQARKGKLPSDHAPVVAQFAD